MIIKNIFLKLFKNYSYSEKEEKELLNLLKLKNSFRIRKINISDRKLKNILLEINISTNEEEEKKFNFQIVIKSKNILHPSLRSTDILTKYEKKWYNIPFMYSNRIFLYDRYMIDAMFLKESSVKFSIDKKFRNKEILKIIKNKSLRYFYLEMINFIYQNKLRIEEPYTKEIIKNLVDEYQTEFKTFVYFW